MVILDFSTVSSTCKTFTPKKCDQHHVIFMRGAPSLLENNMAKKRTLDPQITYNLSFIIGTYECRQIRRGYLPAFEGNIICINNL